MAYPDQLLAEDERVVKHLHPHWATLVAPVVIFVVIVGVASYLAAIMPPGSAQRPLRLAIAGLAVVVVLWLVAVPVLAWRTTHYVITTHRVLIRTGILNHTGRDIPLGRINDVAFEQTLWERMIGAGSLTVESAGERGQETLYNIPHSDRIQQLLNRLIEEDQDRRAREAHAGGQQYPETGRIPPDYPPGAYPQGPYGTAAYPPPVSED
ncbi:MAG TPA: PH domain-containing protein [Mycobacteriales bacterium]|nr:PH domain-containing protein [Mycobacteriales bacterium]